MRIRQEARNGAVFLGAMLFGATIVFLAVGMLSGCSRSGATEAGQTPQAQAAAGTRAPAASPPAAPHEVTMVIPAGTDIVMMLSTPLSTGSNHTGDSFSGTTMDAILVDGRTVVPAGARISGSLRDVEGSGRIKGRARMTLVYEQIAASDGRTHSLSADPLTLQAKSEERGDVEKIVGGGVLGAIVGGITHGAKGAAIGAGAGAGAGTIVVLATKGGEVELGAGRHLTVHLTSATNVTAARGS